MMMVNMKLHLPCMNSIYHNIWADAFKCIFNERRKIIFRGNADEQNRISSSWSRRSEEAKEKVERAVWELKEERELVNFGNVHKKSGVSKHFLYENKEVRSLILVKR